MALFCIVGPYKASSKFFCHLGKQAFDLGKDQVCAATFAVMVSESQHHIGLHKRVSDQEMKQDLVQ